jgi:hypothetical protein
MARVVSTVIWLQPDAPPKPAPGAPCNGCGLCCLAEPCPVGVIVSGRRTGACRALQWSAEARQYRCGMLVHPARYLGWPRARPDAWPNRLVRRWARRMIAAGVGCDADLEAIAALAPSPAAPHDRDTPPPSMTSTGTGTGTEP